MRVLGIVVLSLLLTGCVESGLGGLGGKAPNGPRATPAELRDEADAEAALWNGRASLLSVTGDYVRPDASVFRAPEKTDAPHVDGKMPSWRFTYVVPGSVAMLMVEVGGDGEILDTRKLDLSRFAPGVGQYGEYFALTTIELEWLDTARLVDVLRANETTAHMVPEGEVTSVEYTLRPDVRDLYAWRVTLVDGERFYEAEVNPRTWELFTLTWDDGADEAPPTTVGSSGDATPSGLKVEQVFAKRASSQGPMTTLTYYLELAAGARPLDLADLVVRAKDGDRVAEYRLGDGFELGWLRGSTGGTVLTSGALATVAFEPPQPVEPRSEVEVTLVPPKGTVVDGSFRAPSTYGRNTVVQMR